MLRRRWATPTAGASAFPTRWVVRDDIGVIIRRERRAKTKSVLACQLTRCCAMFGDVPVCAQVRTLIWVHKQRLLGRYKWGRRYMRQCPCRPCSPGTRVYARTLSEAGPTPLLTCQLTLLSHYFPRRDSLDSPEEEAVPLDASTSYLYEQFRDQPFAAAAYLRAILYCWAGGVVLLLQHATSAVLGKDTFPERIAWQWLFCQLVVQLLQVRSCWIKQWEG